MPDIQMKTMVPRPYVGIRRVVKLDGIGPACAEILPRLSQWLAKRGASPVGPPAVVYHAFDATTGAFDMQPAFFLASPLDGEGDVQSGQTAGGEALVAVHVGPYDKLSATWEAVFARAAALGRSVTQSAWESYLDIPGTVDEAKQRTEIVVPLDKA